MSECEHKFIVKHRRSSNPMSGGRYVVEECIYCRHWRTGYILRRESDPEPHHNDGIRKSSSR